MKSQEAQTRPAIEWLEADRNLDRGFHKAQQHRPWGLQPMIMLRRDNDSDASMTVERSDYQDEMRWWL